MALEDEERQKVHDALGQVRNVGNLARDKITANMGKLSKSTRNSVLAALQQSQKTIGTNLGDYAPRVARKNSETDDEYRDRYRAKLAGDLPFQGRRIELDYATVNLDRAQKGLVAMLQADNLSDSNKDQIKKYSKLLEGAAESSGTVIRLGIDSPGLESETTPGLWLESSSEKKIKDSVNYYTKMSTELNQFGLNHKLDEDVVKDCKAAVREAERHRDKWPDDREFEMKNLKRTLASEGNPIVDKRVYLAVLKADKNGKFVDDAKKVIKDAHSLMHRSGKGGELHVLEVRVGDTDEEWTLHLKDRDKLAAALEGLNDQSELVMLGHGSPAGLSVMTGREVYNELTALNFRANCRVNIVSCYAAGRDENNSGDDLRKAADYLPGYRRNEQGRPEQESVKDPYGEEVKDAQGNPIIQLKKEPNFHASWARDFAQLAMLNGQDLHVVARNHYVSVKSSGKKLTSVEATHSFTRFFNRFRRLEDVPHDPDSKVHFIVDKTGQKPQLQAALHKYAKSGHTPKIGLPEPSANVAQAADAISSTSTAAQPEQSQAQPASSLTQKMAHKGDDTLEVFLYPEQPAADAIAEQQQPQQPHEVVGNTATINSATSAVSDAATTSQSGDVGQVVSHEPTVTTASQQQQQLREAQQQGPSL